MKHKKILFIITLLAITAFQFQNCAELINNQGHDNAVLDGNEVDPNSLSAVEYNARIAEAKIVLQKYCVSCHNPVDGTSAKIPDILDFAFLESHNYVVIGSPADSPVYMRMVDKIEPRDGTEVPDYDLESVRLWLIGPIVSDAIISDGGGDTGGSLLPATYANVNAQIIQPACIRCHGANSGRSLATYASLLTNSRIVPRNSTASTIWTRTNLLQNQTGFMPQGANPLTPTQKSLLLRWINAGAPN